MTTQNFVQWPERFVYVCSATQGAATNAAPIVQAGLRKVARVELLVGSSARGADIREAEKPCEDFVRFVDTLSQQHQLRLPKTQMHRGNAEDYGPWTAALSDICDRAEAEGLAVVYNITGGTKPMSLGATFGCLGGGASMRAIMLHVDNEVRPWQILLPSGERVRLAVERDLSLNEYFAAYGLERRKSSQSKALCSFYRANRRTLGQYADFLFAHPLAMKDINRAAYHHGDDARRLKFPIRVKLEQNFSEAAYQALDMVKNCLNLKIYDGEVDVPTEIGWKIVFKGGWLEAALFNDIDKKIGPGSAIEIDTSVTLHEYKDDNAFTDLDVVFITRSQLQIIEAKSGSGQDAAKWFNQIGQTRNRLVGRFGETLVFSAQADTHILNAYQERTDRMNIRLVAGNFSKMLDDLDSCVEAKLAADKH